MHVKPRPLDPRRRIELRRLRSVMSFRSRLRAGAGPAEHDQKDGRGKRSGR